MDVSGSSGVTPSCSYRASPGWLKELPGETGAALVVGSRLTWPAPSGCHPWHGAAQLNACCPPGCCASPACHPRSWSSASRFRSCGMAREATTMPMWTANESVPFETSCRQVLPPGGGSQTRHPPDTSTALPCGCSPWYGARRMLGILLENSPHHMSPPRLFIRIFCPFWHGTQSDLCSFSLEFSKSEVDVLFFHFRCQIASLTSELLWPHVWPYNRPER